LDFFYFVSNQEFTHPGIKADVEKNKKMGYDLKTFEKMDVYSLLVLLVNRLGIKETMAK
jgi:hypothetical protein